MAYYTPTREETFEDRKLYLEGRLVTSRAWTAWPRCGSRRTASTTRASSGARTQSRTARSSPATGPPGSACVHESCSRLKASIESAFREGRIVTSDGTLEPDD